MTLSFHTGVINRMCFVYLNNTPCQQPSVFTLDTITCTQYTITMMEGLCRLAALAGATIRSRSRPARTVLQLSGTSAVGIDPFRVAVPTTIPSQLCVSRRCLASSTAAAAAPPLAAAKATTRTAIITGNVRISKWISQHAAMSRREAERLIRQGDVFLAGKPVQSPSSTFSIASLVDSAGLIVGGKTVHVSSLQLAADKALDDSFGNSSSSSSKRVRVWLVHKLEGELVAEVDPYNRPTVMQRMVNSGVGKALRSSSKEGRSSSKKEHLKAIGRLDMNTEGLLLLTNCGTYARDMELPKNQIHRTYRVRVHGKLYQYKLDSIRRGIRIETMRYAPMKVELEETRKKAESTNQWLKITCAEGKNRQIRNVLKHFGCKNTMSINSGDATNDRHGTHASIVHSRSFQLFRTTFSECHSIDSHLVRRLSAANDSAWHGH